MEFGNLWDKLQDAIQRISDPFQSFAEELTLKEYARQKLKNPRKDVLRNARNTYSYIPSLKKNLHINVEYIKGCS